MRTSAIIPAYNEEDTLGGVLLALVDSPEIDEIIVVSDGSEDNTAQVARTLGARVVELPYNGGKGAAIQAGVEVCKGDVVLLLDADLIGLKQRHVHQLLEPVITGNADMTVGIFRNGRLATDLAQRLAPRLSGQRAVRKIILQDMRYLKDAGYGLEVALNNYAQKHAVRVEEVHLPDLTHIMKEEKLGFYRGFGQRLKMYWQILRGFGMARR